MSPRWLAPFAVRVFFDPSFRDSSRRREVWTKGCEINLLHIAALITLALGGSGVLVCGPIDKPKKCAKARGHVGRAFLGFNSDEVNGPVIIGANMNVA